jgi:hypothetical protein
MECKIIKLRVILPRSKFPPDCRCKDSCVKYKKLNSSIQSYNFDFEPVKSADISCQLFIIL